MEKNLLVPRVRAGAARAVRALPLIPLFILSGCLVPGARTGTPVLEVSSAAFAPGGEIPVMYTCDGANVSPPLSWSAPPQGTESIAILVTDPDAPGGTFVHWVAWNIPPGTREIPSGSAGKPVLPTGSVQGTSDFGRQGYGGPCPPGGKPHHYHFVVYALDSALTLPGKRDGRTLESSVRGHILAQGETIGIYRRI
ncbi:MAG TPA: YbhB/YbcL family Raf kinase inhibitor-like protein [Methanomicrobiales archaeon]|nr:YbhB/YbcL family Raf kinase inhibitor-like protein [Methanomicrobiales archaeon]